MVKVKYLTKMFYTLLIGTCLSGCSRDDNEVRVDTKDGLRDPYKSVVITDYGYSYTVGYETTGDDTIDEAIEFIRLGDKRYFNRQDYDTSRVNHYIRQGLNPIIEFEGKESKPLTPELESVLTNAYRWTKRNK